MAGLNSQPKPPGWAHRLLEWFVAPHLREDLIGDLHEIFQKRVEAVSLARARREYIWAVLHYLSPFFYKRQVNEYVNPKTTDMLQSYFKIAFRNIAKNRVYSLINISGLAVGIAVAMLIGLWVNDELSFNKQFKNYEHIAEVRHRSTEPSTGVTGSSQNSQIPLGTALKNRYHQYFKHILLSFQDGSFTIMAGEKKLMSQGKFIEGDVIDMLSLHMVKGTPAALDDPHSVILAQSTAESLFGKDEPIGKALKIDNRMDVTVTGVYEDLPQNANFGDLKFFAPWALWVSSNGWVKDAENRWDNNSFSVLVQLADNKSLEKANAALTDFYVKNLPQDMVQDAKDYKIELFLYPMSQWHLYSEFKDGHPTAGRIVFVWLFGIVGCFVLLLACINFINLSTARSEKRAKEVGIRKAIGSLKLQLVFQFLSESFLIVYLAFLFALVFVSASLHFFNELAGKAITFPFDNLYFWGTCLLFMSFTALLSGLYPAFYLSSFQPVKTLKGAVQLGKAATLPRKVLVVVQFTVSIVLAIGVFVVYKQIQYAQNRPIGYNREGLLSIPMNDPNYKGREELIQRELENTGMVERTAFSTGSLTSVWSNWGGFNWKNKDPKSESDFFVTRISHDFGALAKWKVLAGRDFSRDFASDSSAVILNESAAKYLNLENPIGEFMTIDNGKKKLQIIGVIKDIVIQSPYEPVKRSLYFLDPAYADASQLTIRLNPSVSPQQALPAVEAVIKKIVPSALFTYSFIDQEFAVKFAAEQRVGRLSAAFTILAILISCLGLFGLASFMAEQRTKEIGIRKVLGASVINIWGLLSREFLILILVAFVLAAPISYYLLSDWLENYQYRTELSWWLFVLAGLGALTITLLTVSYQSIKAALVNPVKSLKIE